MAYDPSQMDPDVARSACWFLILLGKLKLDPFGYDACLTVQPIVDRFTYFISMVGETEGVR